MGSAFAAEPLYGVDPRETVMFLTFPSDATVDLCCHHAQPECPLESPHEAATCGFWTSGTNQRRQRVNGKVKRVFAEKGYGWITGVDGSDYFVHHSEVRGTRLDSLQSGDEVEFTPTDGPKGLRAASVSRS
jgi:CspA family cold shock protein